MTELELQKEIVDILEYCKDRYPVLNKDIRIEITYLNRGTAYYSQNRITIPIWVIQHGINYTYSYVLHEVSHFIAGPKVNHNKIFKNVESTLLKDFGMKPVYRKRYINALFSLNGEQLFSHEKGI